jgi:hypothetical protein
MADPRNLKRNLQLVEIDIMQLLMGETPRLIDEWQVAPQLWDAVRGEVDMRGELGQFILTGSAVPPTTEQIVHTGTGRFAWVKMRPMSLFESGDSMGQVSLGELFSAPSVIRGFSDAKLSDIAYLACRGGWPIALQMTREDALVSAYDYYDAVVKTDVTRADGITRDVERTKRFMRAYARSQGSQTPMSKICDDMRPNDADTLDVDTVTKHHNALKKIFVIEDMAAWNPNLRSKSAIRTSDTRYFVDPSIACAAFGIGPDGLIADLNTFGLVFETLVMRDLRVYADVLGGEVYHYRDSSGLECDAVVHLHNGSYGLIEVKLGGDTAIEYGATNLLRLKDKIDTSRMREPSFMAVVTAVGEYAYRRSDGVYVVPITTLKL